jgi:methionine-rich copper-binding protein CopC
MRKRKIGLLIAVLMMLILPKVVWAHTESTHHTPPHTSTHHTPAHTELQSAEPAPNATVTNPVQELKLIFYSPIKPDCDVTIRSENGQVIRPSKVQASDRKALIQLNSTLPNGRYHVHWKVVSIDGHPDQGEYDFRVQMKNSPTPTLKNLDKPEASPSAPANHSEGSFQGQSDYTFVIVLVAMVAVMVGIWLIDRKR